VSETRNGLPILAFADISAWEAWLSAAPRTSAGLWLKIAKAGNPAASVTKAEAIDAALCNGWIDGQQHPYDQSWWLTRFTPRKARSKWSEKNRTRALELLAAGRMLPGGRAEIEAAQADGRWEAAYAPASTATAPPDLAAALDVEPAARAFFDTLTGVRRYAILYRIADAKRPETRAARIAKYVAMCVRGETIG
jgi:uncharacterized protein YdeI (YjbR/CyaY-like superfamily)